MGIVTGQTVEESDFMLSLTAGEDITADDAVLIGNGSDSGALLLQINSSDDGNQSCSGTTWVAQKVRFPAVRNITHIGFKHVSTQSATFTVRIRASLTGADLASGSSTPGSNNGSITYRTIALTAPVDLDPNTDYYVIFSGSYTVYGQTTSTFPSGEAHVSTNSGSSWSTHGTVADFGVYLVGGLTEAGKVYKAIASLQSLFAGFAPTTTSAGVSCSVNPQLVLNGMFSGLTPGALYYLSDTPGVLATSGTYLVGIAISSTSLLRLWQKN